MEKDLIDIIGVVAAVSLPMFNIPLVMKIIQRKSSRDLSMSWVVGVWVCLLLMLPAGVRTEDIVLKAFSIVNIALFSVVLVVAFKYRTGESS
ncbi:MAG: hypothetical protein KC684_03575 [Candidatus Omnitrophica bacterium]|nr:hypothetical protein [Candidatus Omnitrophota bacterium]